MTVQAGRKKGVKDAKPPAMAEDTGEHRYIPSRLVDGIKTIEIFNDIARVSFTRLDPEGVALPAVELCIPVERVRDIVEALSRLP